MPYDAKTSTKDIRHRYNRRLVSVPQQVRGHVTVRQGRQHGSWPERPGPPHVWTLRLRPRRRARNPRFRCCASGGAFSMVKCPPHRKAMRGRRAVPPSERRQAETAACCNAPVRRRHRLPCAGGSPAFLVFATPQPSIDDACEDCTRDRCHPEEPKLPQGPAPDEYRGVQWRARGSPRCW